jgi:hypothetical protein
MFVHGAGDRTAHPFSLGLVDRHGSLPQIKPTPRSRAGGAQRIER